MNTQSIVKQNQQFYKNISKQFSNTRQYSWKGWDEVFNQIDIKDKDTIIDIACGNGRFLKFLNKKYKSDFEYFGLDYDENLLNTAINEFNDKNNIKFIKFDVINNLKKLKNNFNVVVAFGITHHIPDYEFRLNWFKKLSKLVKKDGYLVFSNWNFLDKNSVQTAPQLQENDYWVGWGDTDQKRYCHYYNNDEMQNIIKVLNDNNTKLIKIINNENDLNSYYVFKKF